MVDCCVCVCVYFSVYGWLLCVFIRNLDVIPWKQYDPIQGIGCLMLVANKTSFDVL